MAYLLLDLDETAILYQRENGESLVHDSHVLSVHLIDAQLGDSVVSVRIINPEKLAQLIEAAYEGDGVVIMTAGYWNSNITYGIANYLMEHFNLNQEVGEQFKKCLFFSPLIEAHFRSLDASQTIDLELIRHALKAHRFDWMVSAYPQIFSNKYFTFLDDNVSHINSFNGYTNVTAVWAETKNQFFDFYEIAAQCLRLQHALEVELANIAALYKNSASFFYQNPPVDNDTASVCSDISFASIEPFENDDESSSALDSSMDSTDSANSVNSTGSAITYKNLNTP